MVRFSVIFGALIAGSVACNGGEVITVGTGTTPEYTWEGGPASQITVMRGDLEDGDYAWAVIHPGGDEIESPVVHGVVPPGATELYSDELELTAGETYSVWVQWSDETRETVSFTP
jgi:hypothetical protein